MGKCTSLSTLPTNLSQLPPILSWCHRDTLFYVWNTLLMLKSLCLVTALSWFSPVLLPHMITYLIYSPPHTQSARAIALPVGSGICLPVTLSVCPPPCMYFVPSWTLTFHSALLSPVALRDTFSVLYPTVTSWAAVAPYRWGHPSCPALLCAWRTSGIQDRSIGRKA